MKRRILFLLSLTLSLTCGAQDLDRLFRKPWFSQSGAVSLDLQYNSRAGGPSPWNYTLVGHYEPVLLGIALPISLAYSSANGIRLDHPFNRWRIAPRYKWISASFGRSSMSFSPYTLNGIEFSGIGLKLSPGEHWQFATMVGKLADAKPGDSLNAEIPSLLRRAYALRIAYQRKAFHLGFQLLQAGDRPDSLVPLKAQQNLAMSIEGHVALGHQIEIRGEIAQSWILTRTDERSVWNLIWEKKQKNQNLESFRAGKISIGHPYFNIAYEEVAPGYQSFGAYYFNNDFRNITANGQYAFQRLQFGISFGLEQTNLDQTQSQSQRRIVASANIQAQIGQRWQVRADYSNFQSHLYIKNLMTELDPNHNPLFEDTLSFRQINQQAQIGVQWQIPSKNARQSLSADVSAQASRQLSTDYYGHAQLAYQYQGRNHQRFGLSIQSSLQKNPQESLWSLGSSAFFQMAWLENHWRWRLALSYQNMIDGPKQDLLSLQSTLSYRLGSAHELSFQLKPWVQMRLDNSPRWDMMALLSYRFQFKSR